MARELRLLGVHIDHPGQRDRAAGAKSRVYLAISSDDLKSRPVHQIPLDEGGLVRLIRDAAEKLAILRGVR